MDFLYLQALRSHELARALPHFPPGGRVLEIGAGAGWQAQTLAQKDFDVEAIDLACDSVYRAARVFPVREYNGSEIPYPDGSFDALFSSHVLEHISDLTAFSSEMARVLRPQGIAIHIMPSVTWRLLTTALHYPGVLKEAARRLGAHVHRNGGKGHDTISGSRQRSMLEYLLRFIYPHRHGERGNVWSEAYYFSARFWRTQFESCNWEVSATTGTGIVYSGYSLCGNSVSLNLRQELAVVLGSSSRIYVTRPKHRKSS